jgi:hypothetical protein
MVASRTASSSSALIVLRSLFKGGREAMKREEPRKVD